MRNLSQSEIGIPEEFRGPIDKVPKSRQLEKNDVFSPSMPYHGAIEEFSNCRRMSSPSDILHCILTCLRLLNSEAKEYWSNHRDKPFPGLTADDQFPIVIWVVIHARLPDINTRLAHIDRFIDEPVKNFGEVGLALCLIQAAVGFVGAWKGIKKSIKKSVKKSIKKSTIKKSRKRLASRKKKTAE